MMQDNMYLQYIIVGSILLVCIGLAARHVYRTLTDADSACGDCQLKKSCKKHGRKLRRPADGCGCP